MTKGMTMIETLRDFITRMDRLGVEYMVTGSYAMSAYGEIRMTKDIDIVVQLGQNQAHSFFELFKDDYYVSETSVRRAIDQCGMFNIINLAHAGKIDCIIRNDSDFARTSFSRRYKETVAGIDFWTTTREDLIVSKLNWAKDTHSEMQIRDVANLTKSEYDAEYVRDWVGSLGLQSVWAEVEKWKIQHEPLED